jgi:D-methionine transport system substrate-binding protein
MQRRFILKLAAVFSATAVLANVAQADETIKVGVTGGPHAQVMEVVKQVAANSYQHAPYLDAQVKDRGYKLIKVADTVTFPMGIYSKKFKSLAQLPAGARIAVPNDPTNGGRALLLLQKNGLLKLRADAGLKATPLDIIDNPRKLKIVELDAAQIPRSLADVDAAAINTNFAMEAGLKPKQDAIAIEDPNGPYSNVIAIRAVDKDKPWVAKLVAAYHSPEVKQFIEAKYAGAVIAAW